MMDDLIAFNKQRWEELAQANVAYSQPFLTLTPETACALVDPKGVMGPIEGRDVLCLAGGGGQQSAAFALLGARVTVVDLSETQLERDQQALAHYELEATLLQRDMRDLSVFAPQSFDLVWHAHSLNFIPDAQTVFDQVARVLRPGGGYWLSRHNPFVHGTTEADWTGKGYALRQPYLDGAEVIYDDPHWDFTEDGVEHHVLGPREFKHTLSGMVNGLIARGFTLGGIWETSESDAPGPPGSWAHFMSVAPPYLCLWLTRNQRSSA